jgi:hypothetical protein
MRLTSWLNNMPDEMVVTVEIDQDDDGATVCIPVEINDLSTSGAKLIISQKLPSKSKFVIRLEIPAKDIQFAVDGIVQGMRPRVDGTWWLDCTFPVHIEDSVVDSMCTGGYLERRKDTRNRVDVPFQTRWENAQRCLPTQMIDASDGGFCLVVPIDFQSDEQSKLESVKDGETQSPPVRTHKTNKKNKKRSKR